jgi:flagellar M-ring protein FliF
VNSFVETLKQLGAARLGVMGAITLGLLVFFSFVSMRVSSPEMKMLYADLSSADSGAIAAALETNTIPYTVSENGARIMVSEDSIGRARMLLAEAGLPNGGSLGYELFDKQSGFGTTNFVQNINQVRALEGELSRTISSLDSIRSTRVHLVLPQRELFSRESRPSSASVFLGIRPGANLDRGQITGIQSLVASAVPDLKFANVSIIDSNGNLLAKGGEDETNLLSMKAEEMRRNFEGRLTQKVEDQVSRIVGYGNVRAAVTAEMNFDRISTNEELYDPEGQVVRSTQTTEESSVEREPIESNVSIENNLPGIGGDLLSDSAPSAEGNRIEEVTNFEISKTIRNTIREAGDVQRLSISVLVDGRYTTDAETGEKTYEARPQEELDQIAKLVQSAIGFDDERGDLIEVVNLQFAEIDTNEGAVDIGMILGFQKSDLLDTAEIVTVAIMVILVVLLVLQPMVGKLLAVEKSKEEEAVEADLLAPMAANPALAGPSGDGLLDGEDGDESSMINISGVEGKVKASTVKKVEEIVDSHPSETVAVIRSWMTEET